MAMGTFMFLLICAGVRSLQNTYICQYALWLGDLLSLIEKKKRENCLSILGFYKYMGMQSLFLFFFSA